MVTPRPPRPPGPVRPCPCQIVEVLPDRVVCQGCGCDVTDKLSAEVRAVLGL